MINKKAQFFSLYLVVLTIFMISLSLGFYLYQNFNLTHSFIPYSQIERIKLEQRTFEFNEIDYILDSVKKTQLDLGDSFWGTSDFAETTKLNFINKLSGNLDSSIFILKNISYNRIIVDYNRIINELSYRESFLALGYKFSFIEINGEKVLNVSRSFDKKILLVGDRKKNSFPVELTYYLQKQYLITKSGSII